MKLYGNKMSPNSRKAQIVMALLGIEFEFHEVDLLGGGTHSEAFLKLNPNGRIPVLVDGDFVLWESNAICQYLAARHPESGLFPADERARADISRWQCWELAHFGKACHTLTWERVVKKLIGAGPADPAEEGRGESQFRQSAAVLEAQLHGRTWVVDPRLTIADVSLACALLYAEPAAMPLDDYPAIRAWRARVQALDAWVKFC